MPPGASMVPVDAREGLNTTVGGATILGGGLGGGPVLVALETFDLD